MSCRLLRRIGAVLAVALVMASLWCHGGPGASAQSKFQVEQVLLGSDFGSCSSLQHLLDTELADMAGKGAEFVVLAIRQYDQGYNFDAYLAALEKYLAGAATLPATTMQKIALVQYACGGISSDRALEVAKETEGQQGIMSVVFALHIYSNLGRQEDVQRCITILLDQQATSGGWGLSLETPTVDITAMTIQALAPYYDAVLGVKEAVDKAMEYIRESQQPSGDFLSYGMENCESVAQVIIAMCALGTDYKTEMSGEFGTLVDVMGRYQQETGGFAHTQGGQVNMTATSQAIMALVAMERANRGAGPIYTLGEYEIGSSDLGEKPVEEPIKIKRIQSVVAVCVLVAFAVYLAIGCAKRKFTAMDIITVSVVGLAVSAFVFFSHIETPEQYYSYNLPEITEDSPTVSLSICDGERELVAPQEYALLEGDTVFDIVSRVTRAGGIPLGYVSGWEVYISSIGDLSEGDRGATSGWVYYVNGLQPDVSVSSYKLQPGDVVELRYVESYGGAENE